MPPSLVSCRASAPGLCIARRFKDLGSNADFDTRSTTTLDLEGYVAVDTVREEIVVAFRGTSGLRNWIADFDFILVSYSGCSDCYVHDGFYESWKEVQDYVLEYVEEAYTSYPDYTLVVTGHSLGAAVGTLAAAQLRADG